MSSCEWLCDKHKSDLKKLGKERKKTCLW